MFAFEPPQPVSAPCVSLVIEGRLLRQRPTELPVDGDNIVVRWPWRITLRADSVVLGEFPEVRLEAIAVQHGEIGRGYGRTFLLGRIDDAWRLLTISEQRLTSSEEIEEAAVAVGSSVCR